MGNLLEICGLTLRADGVYVEVLRELINPLTVQTEIKVETLEHNYCIIKQSLEC